MRPARTATVLAALAAALVAATGAPAAPADDAYATAIASAEGMPGDARVVALAARHGLDVVNVAWEDTGRYANSAVGSNISDLSLQVEQCDDARTGEPDCSLHLMPAIRNPNFADVTADVPLDRFRVLVGNEHGAPLRAVALRDVLADLPAYLHAPDGEVGSLLAPRDTHALVSAQAAFLPVPRGGIATFNPVLFNYQSVPGDPAVLTLVATPEGTSATVIDNARDQFQAGPTWGQRLFFNRDGQRASLTGRRLSDVASDPAAGTGPGAGPAPRDAGSAGLGMVLIVQVPLRQREPMRYDTIEDGAVASAAAPAAAEETADAEQAVIGHGADEGPFTELAGLAIERDPAYPIRVTVQLYKATETGVVDEATMSSIRDEIDRVYADGDYVGSLVVDGVTGRPTEHDGPRIEPLGWWRAFAERLAEHLPQLLAQPRGLWWRAG